MKYIIDAEKIEGTNLWKAKEFNTLVFDKNGLMKLIALEDELGDYHVDLRNEIYELRRKLDNEIFKNEDCSQKLEKRSEKIFELKKYNSALEKDVKDFDNICSKLKTEIADLKVDLKEHKVVCKVAFEDMDYLKKENKMLVEKNVDLEDMRMKLLNKNAELIKKYDEKCLLLERLLDKFPKEENVPIEEVVGAIAHLIHYTRSASGLEKEDIDDMINFFIELLEKEDEKDRQTTKLAS